jgi:hypothetical protein
MTHKLIQSKVGYLLAAAAAVLMASGAAGAQTYVEFSSATGAGGSTPTAAVRLQPTTADATISVYGYLTSDGDQYLYVGVSIANNGREPLVLLPASCAYTDDQGRRTSGGSLFSGQMALASATVAAGGRDNLQLGFAVPDGVRLSDIRAVTVDLVFSSAGQPYAVQTRFSKAPAAAPPVVAPPAVTAPPAAVSPVVASPATTVPSTSTIPAIYTPAVTMPVTTPYTLTPMTSIPGTLPLGGYSNPYTVATVSWIWDGWNGLVPVTNYAYAYNYSPYAYGYYPYGGWWDGGVWSTGGWGVYISLGDGYLFRHRRPHDRDGDDHRRHDTAPASTTISPTTLTTTPATRPGWTAVSSPSTAPTARSMVDATGPVYVSPRTVPAPLPAGITSRATVGAETSTPISTPGPVTVRTPPRVSPSAVPSLPNITPTLPNIVPTLPNISPTLPNITPRLPNITPVPSSVRTPGSLSPGHRSTELPTTSLESPTGPARGQP